MSQWKTYDSWFFYGTPSGHLSLNITGQTAEERTTLNLPTWIRLCWTRTCYGAAADDLIAVTFRSPFHEYSLLRSAAVVNERSQILSDLYWRGGKKARRLQFFNLGWIHYLQGQRFEWIATLRTAAESQGSMAGIQTAQYTVYRQCRGDRADLFISKAACYTDVVKHSLSGRCL